jgi:hypothetical protein
MLSFSKDEWRRRFSLTTAEVYSTRIQLIQEFFSVGVAMLIGVVNA